MSLEVYPQSGPPGPIGPTASVLFSAGTLSAVRSDITFNNGSGVTFGLDAGGVITATVQTNYQTPGAYLTTAMASDRGSDFVQATAGFFGTNATGTIASDGISVSVNAGGGSLNISAGSTSSNVSAVTFSNGSGVTFGFDGSNVTASVQTNYQTPGAYLTTAALSQDSSKYAGTGFTTATTAGTNVVGTLNTSGLSLGVPAYLTTSPAGGAGTGFTSTSTVGSNIVGTLDTNGISVGVPNYLTTAMASNATTLSNILVSEGNGGRSLSSIYFRNNAVNQFSFGFLTDTTINDLTGSWYFAVFNTAGSGHPLANNIELSDANGVSWGISSNGTQPTVAYVTATVRTNYAGTATSVATTTGTDLSFAANTSGITIAYPKWITTASGGGAGTGFSTATTAGTAVVGTLDSNGLSMGVPAYLTTAALSGDTSKYAGTATSVVTTTGTDLSMALNTNGLTVAYPKWITTAGAGGIAASNSQTLFSTGTVAFSEGGGAITIASSAGGQSLMFSVPQTSSLVGVAPASISTSGSTISVQVSAIAGVGVSNTGNTAGNVGYLTGSNYALAGSGSLTLSQSTAAGAATCWIQHPAWLTTAALSGDTSKYAGVNGSVATTAGTDLALTLNTSGATIGYPKWITTAAQSSVMMSWFQNLDMLDPGSSTMSYGGSVINICPFVLPAAMSVGFVRLAGSMSYVSTEASGTTANTTYTVNRSYTHCVMLFTQNTGASSLSLNLLTSSSASWLFQNQIQAGAQGSRYTVTQNVTYPISGTTSNYTTSYPQSSANVQISAASMTLFTGPRFVDIPLGVSLSASNYWIAFGMSTNSASQAGNAALGNASAGFSMIAVSQNNLTFGLMGQVTNSSVPIQPGCGSWSTNAAVMSTASIALANVSAMSSNPKPYFQMLRYA